MVSERGGPDVPHDFPDLNEMDESAQVREVYAWVGLALYYAQVLEFGLVNLIHVVMGVRGTLQDRFSSVDEFYNEKFRRMLGQLLGEVRDLQVLSDETVDLVGQAVKRRNSLVHAFYRERAELFTGQEGRRLMLSELRDLVELFMRADHATEEILYAWGRESGITPDAVAARLEQLRRDSAPPEP